MTITLEIQVDAVPHSDGPERNFLSVWLRVNRDGRFMDCHTCGYVRTQLDIGKVADTVSRIARAVRSTLDAYAHEGTETAMNFDIAYTAINKQYQQWRT